MYLAILFFACPDLACPFVRHSHPDQVEEQKGRVAAQQKEIKLASTSLSLTVPLMMSPRLS